MSPDKGFLLNVLVSQSIIEVLEVENIPNCSIKWPNDIVKGDKKLGGILIKTSIQKKAIQSAVIGVGLNINQVNFQENAGDPVSMKLISGESFSIENIFERICDRIEVNYIALENGRYSQLMKSYNGHLYGCGELVYANLNEKELIQGTLDNVDIHGRITLIIDGRKETYSYPEIRLMNNRKQ